MAVTRAFLKGLGLSKEQEDAIIEAHTETVDGLKQSIADIQKKLDDSKDYEKKFHEKETEFNDYKQKEATKAEKETKRKLYSDLLDKAKVSPDIKELVLQTVDYDSFEVKDGKVTDENKAMSDIKSKYGKFITTTQTKPAIVANPPENAGGKTMTKEEIMAIPDRSERRQAIKEHAELFAH